MKLKLKKLGINELWEQRNILNEFVKDNFELLYKGACRMCLNLEENDYAPRRVLISNTRLHERIGLKYADNHKYDAGCAPTEAQLRNTVRDIQDLINEAAKVVKCSFKIIIKIKDHETKI